MALFTFQLRRGTAIQWATKNPILGEGEPGVELDTKTFKIGNGVDPWTALPYYLSQDSITQYINEQIASLPPIGPDQIEQIADLVTERLDFPDLVVLWENAKA